MKITIKSRLKVSLKEIILSINGYNDYEWFIIYYYGYGQYSSMIETKLKKAKVRKVSIDELLSLEENIYPSQIIDLSLVAFFQNPDFSKIDFDCMIQSSIISVELIDSSFWEINAPYEIIDQRIFLDNKI